MKAALRVGQWYSGSRSIPARCVGHILSQSRASDLSAAEKCFPSISFSPAEVLALSLSLFLFLFLFYTLIVRFAEQKGVRYRFWHYILALRRDERNQVVKIPKWQRTLSPHVDGVPILEDGRTHLGMSAGLRPGVTSDRPPTEGALPSCGTSAVDAGLGPVL